MVSDARKASMKAYYESNKESLKASRKVQRATNREKINARQREYHSANREYRLICMAKWAQENKEAKNALNAKRRASKLQRTPSWANLDKIAEMYELAQFATEESGVPYHVDHIIPLQGAKVSGLHVYENLRVIPAKENLRKNNRYEC